MTAIGARDGRDREGIGRGSALGPSRVRAYLATTRDKQDVRLHPYTLTCHNSDIADHHWQGGPGVVVAASVLARVEGLRQ